VLGHRTPELAPATKNTVFGLITFAGLVVAILWQPIIGDISDRTHSPWGRRIPISSSAAAPPWSPPLLLAIAPGWLRC
jgi:MFS family permease